MVDTERVIDRYYGKGTKLREILEVHSNLVARKALECAQCRKLDIDTDFVREASLLHDIGIIRCNAPGIECFGKEPYICHGILGRGMLDELGLYRHGLVCERHTGSGLSAHYIEENNLPLPHRDMLPVSLEEKLICYADKFYSKSGDIREEKALERVIASMARHGQEALDRFMELHEMFGIRN